MTPAMRSLVRGVLEALQPRYKPTTFSYKSIEKWLQAIEEVESAGKPVAHTGGEEAGEAAATA